MGVTASQITQALTRLLPRGAAWRTTAGRNLYRVLQAAADELLRVYGRADDLLAEAHPLSIDELLDEWEHDLGLPDDCVTFAQTDDERRAAIAAKLRAVGGQSRQYYIDVAAGMGVSITIEELQPFYVGVDGCGDGIGGAEWIYTWVVHAPPFGAETYADCATAVAGDPLASGGGSVLLECTFQGIKPAHTVLLFEYDG